MGRAALLVLLFLLTACSGGQAVSTQSAPSAAGGQGAGALPPEPTPSADGPCPYLDTAFVADTNGQRVGKVKISADKPHPACFFYRPDGEQQLSVRLYSGQAATAGALVDRAAPPSSSSRAQLDGGWTGGSQVTDNGAVFAVTKDGEAIVVTSNQKQTIKCKAVAQHVIRTMQSN